MLDSCVRQPEVAVVGAGIGGLVAASCLARWGRSVALLEAGAGPGGYLASFRREGATFDACVDSVGSVFEADGSPGLLGQALEAAGVLEDVAWVELDPIRVQCFPGFALSVPRGTERLSEALETLFPSCRSGLREAVGALGRIHARTRRAFGFPVAAQPALGFRDQPFGAFLSRFGLTEEAAAALASYATFLGASPREVSTRAMADLWMSYVEGGGWRVAGGFGRLADALAQRVVRAGGAVVMGCRAGRPERAGEFWRIPTSLGPIAARRLVWAAAPPWGIEGATLSSSFAILYALAAGEPEHPRPSTGVFPRAGLDFQGCEADPFGGAGGVSLALEAEGKDPEGLRTMVLHWPVRPHALRSVPKTRVEASLRRILTSVVPGTRIVWSSAATPSTLERYTGNPGGAAYGWEQSPEWLAGPSPGDAWPHGMGRAGHWAGLGGGVIPAALSGWRAARRVAEGKDRLG